MIIIRACSGYPADVGMLMQIAKLLVEMGYTVKRVRIPRKGQKALVNAIMAFDENEEGQGNAELG